MMPVSPHARISGTPQMVRVWDAFLRYAKSRPGVAFLRKDGSTRFVLKSPITLRLTLRWVWPRTGVQRAPRWRHPTLSRSRRRHPLA